MNKKIAFIGPLPPPIGGVAQANLKVQNLILQNYGDYEVLNYNTSKGTTHADLYKTKGIKEVLHALKNIFGFLKFNYQNKPYINNVFVVPNISFVREAIFILILKLLNRRTVVHLHAKVKGDLFLSGFKLVLFTKIIGLADVVFVLSEEYHREFYQNYIDKRKLVVLENFINVKEFDNEIELKTSNFLYVGRLSEKKGFLTLVKAVSQIKEQIQELKIHVLGAFENKTFENRCLEIIKLNNINNFIFHGPVMGNEKVKYFKENSVFIFPSYFENSPIVLKEATAAKMAILAADIEENRLLVKNYKNSLFFKAQNDKDLAEKMLLLYRNKSLINELILQSQKAKLFDDDQAKKVIEEYIIN